MNIIDIPLSYQKPYIPGPGQYSTIPNQTAELFERFAWNYFKHNLPNTQSIYVPIMWTDYHCNHGWRNYFPEELQPFINTIQKQHPNKHFWTICNGAFGILVDFPSCTIFSSGGSSDVPNGRHYTLYDRLSSISIDKRHEMRAKVTEIYQSWITPEAVCSRIANYLATGTY